MTNGNMIVYPFGWVHAHFIRPRKDSLHPMLRCQIHLMKFLIHKTACLLRQSLIVPTS